MKGLLAIAAVLVGVVLLAAPAAVFSDPNPDGLQRVANDRGFARAEADHALADGPLAEYRFRGAPDGQPGAVAAGAIGIIAAFGATAWLTRWLRRAGGDE